MEVTSPAELNETSEETLKARVAAAICDSGLESLPQLPPLAPYITLELLLRVHNVVAEYSQTERGGWPKQAALAKAVISLTGASRPKDFLCIKDFEWAGNLMDASLSKYQEELRLAWKGALKSAGKARKAGRDPPPYSRLAELQAKVYRCSRGCTPPDFVLQEGCSSVGRVQAAPIHKQPTKWRVHDAAAQLNQMQTEIAAAREAPEEVSILQRCLRAEQNQKAVAHRREEKALAQARESAAEVAAQKKKVELLELEVRDAKNSLKEQKKSSESAIKTLEKKNLVLGAQIAKAIQEGIGHHQHAQATASTAAKEKIEAEAREAALRQAKATMAAKARAAALEAEAFRANGMWSQPRTNVRGSKRERVATDDSLSDRSNDESDPAFDKLEPCFAAALDAAAANAASKAAARESTHAAAAEEALKRQRDMPTWRPARGQGSGKGAAKLEYGTRIIIYSLLAMMVPCSAIGLAIVAIVKRTAPWLNPTSPTVETIRRCRFELRYVEEVCSARRVAAAYRVRGIGFDETTKLGNGALTSNVTIEPTAGAPFEDVIMRAAYCPMGGTSELVVKSIDQRCFRRSREMLRAWESKFKEMHPQETWTGPDPARLGLHQLGGGGAIQSDTCTTARKSKRLLAALVADSVEEHLGAEKWATMSEEERERAVRTHEHDCWQHLRNIFLAEMASAQAAHMKEELKAELETFSSWERMSTEYSQLLRATYKEFHHGCRYYKGKGRAYESWLLDHHPKAFIMHLERADGGRQDLDFDAAIPIFISRKYFVQYFHEIVFGAHHSNILEDFLYVTHRSLQFVAATRANAIIDLLISRPLRWLTGKSSELTEWSPYSMGRALDAVEEFFLRAQHDGSLFFDPALDLFKFIADEQPLFREWREHMFNKETRQSPDGSVKHVAYKLVRDELLQPSDPTNMRTRTKTIEYLEVQCIAALRKMHDPKLALRDKLTSQDGANAFGKQAQGHADTQGCHSSNDSLAESVFGTFDYILRRFGGISMEAASAVAQAVRSKISSFGDHVLHRKKKTNSDEPAPPTSASIGWLHQLPPKEQEALVEVARLTVYAMRDIDRADHRELDEYHKALRKTNEEEELDALLTLYGYALSFFDRWRSRGVKTMGEVKSTLTKFGPNGERTQAKLDWLREQVEMRSIGLSWTQFKGQWFSSKDEITGTVEQLTAHLEAILKFEEECRRNKELPADDCPAPTMKRKTYKSLGTPTVQADALSDERIDLTPEEVRTQAVQRRKELELAGEIDWVGDRQPDQKEVPLDHPHSLVGVGLEVRWRYYHKESGTPVYIWSQGEVVQVADGKSDKMTARCKKILPASAVRIKWPADAEFDEQESFVWSILKPANFNKDVHLGWRLDGPELLKREAAAMEKAAKRSRGRARGH